MPSSDFVARENLSAWQRWELAALEPAPAHESAAGAQPREALEAEARAAGYAAGMAAAASDRARLTALVAALGEHAGRHEQALCDEVLDLALVLARQLVGQALEVRRELVRPIVAAALAQLPQSTQRVELRLNPADLALVDPLIAEPHGGVRCNVVADPLIAPGGCEIETEQCSVDATMPTRWRQLLANLGRTDDWLEPL
jgi:flagellar assembly protein FliH